MVRIRTWSIAALLIVVFVTPGFGKDKKSKKENKPEIIDSGSFGLFVSGRRVATETFTIKQLPDMSITTSDIKLEGSNQSQHSELQLTPYGSLIRYDWKENGSAEKGETSVVPSDQFLTQQVRTNDKFTEQPYLMPSSSAILDDYFISQRELLLWRYLGAGCVVKPGEKSCTLEPAKYGFIVPRQRTSGMATISYLGKEGVILNGAAQELDKFSLSSEFGDWILYLDQNKKLVRALVQGEEMEVVRDVPADTRTH